jgi:hypothetical protein
MLPIFCGNLSTSSRKLAIFAKAHALSADVSYQGRLVAHMADRVRIDKKLFDAVLRKLLRTPPAKRRRKTGKQK